MSQLSQLMKSSVTASITAASLFGSVTMCHAAPLHTPINRVEVTLRQLPFHTAGWTVKHENASHLATRLNELRAIVPAWEFTPESCTPPTDYTTFSLARKILRTADIQTFTNRRLERNFILALAPDSSDIENVIPVAMDFLDGCSDISVTNRYSNPWNKVTAQGTVTELPTPHVPGASKVYAFKLSGHAILPSKGGAIRALTENPADAPHGSQQGSGVIYAALVRNVWVVAIEGGHDGNTAELQQVFNKQIALINHAR